MHLINLHAHTLYSDGHASMACMAVRAKELGFTALVVTDHVYTEDTVDTTMTMTFRRYKHAKLEAEAITKLGMPVIVGIELSVKEIGEEIAVFGEQAILSIYKMRERYKQVTVRQLKTLRQHTKCVLNLCHPSNSTRVFESGCHLILDGYEKFNRCADFFPERNAELHPGGVADPYAPLGMLPLCNSDSHQVHTLSSCYNATETPITTEQELIQYIKEKKPFRHIVNSPWGDKEPENLRGNYI